MSPHPQQPTPPRAAAAEYDATTAALEPLVREMERKINEAIARRNIALSTAAIMKAVG